MKIMKKGTNRLIEIQTAFRPVNLSTQQRLDQTNDSRTQNDMSRQSLHSFIVHPTPKHNYNTQRTEDKEEQKSARNISIKRSPTIPQPFNLSFNK